MVIKFDNLLLEVKDGQLLITDGDEVESVSLKVLQSQPRSVVKKILRLRNFSGAGHIG